MCVCCCVYSTWGCFYFWMFPSKRVVVSFHFLVVIIINVNVNVTVNVVNITNT